MSKIHSGVKETREISQDERLPGIAAGGLQRQLKLLNEGAVASDSVVSIGCNEVQVRVARRSHGFTVEEVEERAAKLGLPLTQIEIKGLGRSQYFLTYTTSDEKRDWHGRTELHRAAQEGKIDVAKILIQNGYSNINAPVRPSTHPHDDRYSPLMLALWSNQPQIVTFFSECKGLQINAVDAWGHTALHHAFKHDDSFNPDNVAALLRHPRINLNAKDNSGLTPFDLALDRTIYSSNRAFLDCLRLLVQDSRFDPTACKVDPLYQAVDSGNQNLFSLILDDPKIDVNRKVDKFGRTALWLCPASDGNEHFLDFITYNSHS